jgi:phosphonoacetaldehyde hydrolase
MMHPTFSNGHRIELVIFDLAGTVVDFGSCAPVVSIQRLFSDYGIALTPSQIRRDMGMDKREHLKKLANMGDFENQWEKKMGRPVETDDLDMLYMQFNDILKTILDEETRLIPGVLKIQDYLRRNDIRIATTTGYSREMSHIVLRQACQQGFEPDINICNCDVPQGRPSPWMVIVAAQKLGNKPPAQVVNVGDTLVDVQAGRNAGMWSVGVSGTGNLLGLDLEDELKLSEWERNSLREEIGTLLLSNGAHYAVGSLTELPTVIEDINNRLTRGEKPQVPSLVEQKIPQIRLPEINTSPYSFFNFELTDS